MSRAFSFNDGISYTKPIQEIKNHQMKNKQKEKIIHITTHKSFVSKYSEDLLKFFFIKIFYLFSSGFIKSMLNEMYTNYLKRIMEKSGLEKKIKLKLGNPDHTN
jgi:hypothetical protein